MTSIEEDIWVYFGQMLFCDSWRLANRFFIILIFDSILTNNKIQCIQDESFRGLRNLRVL